MPDVGSVLARAQAIFAARAATPTTESAADWAAKTVEACRKAFWSAKLYHAEHVADLKEACLQVLKGDRVKVRDLHSTSWSPAELEEEVDPVTGQLSPGSGFKRGDMTIQMSRSLIITEMRARALERGLDAQSKAGRIQLITEMAVGTSIGQARWEADANNATGLQVAPARRFVRIEPRKEPRDWDTRWYEAAQAVNWEGVFPDDNGATKIAMFNSPIWVELSAFGNPFPPFDYNSGMGLEDVFAWELDKMGWHPNQPPPPKLDGNVEIDISDLPETEKKWLLDQLGDIGKMDGGKLVIGNKFAVPTAQQQKQAEQQKVISALQEALAKKQAEEAEAIRKAQEEFAKKLADPTIGGADAFGSTLKSAPVTVGGSTGAKVFTDGDGQKWVVKTYAGKGLNVSNEYVANRLYAAAGVSVPEARLSRDAAGELGIASKWLDGVHTVGMGGLSAAGKKKEVKGGFAVDAWLANWDVAGLSGDNIVKDATGKFFRVDQGGALLFRAQGSPKGAAFGSVVGELQTLRSAAMNPASAKVFGKLTDVQIAKQIDTLRKTMTAETIHDIIAGSGMEAATAAQLEKTLTARLDYMGDWAKKVKAADKAAKQAAKLAAAQAAKAAQAAQQAAQTAQTYAGPGTVAKAVPNMGERVTDPHKLRAATRKAYAACTQEQKDGMRYLTGSQYGRINTHLATGNGDTTAAQWARGAEEALHQLPTYEGTWGRGHCPIRDLRNKDGTVTGWGCVEKWASGEWAQWSNKGFTHGSICPGKVWTKEFKVFVRLNGTHGGWVDPISSHSGEMEYILEPGVSYRVVGVGMNKSKTRAFLVLQDTQTGDIIPEKQAPPKVYDYDQFMKDWEAEWAAKGQTDTHRVN